MNSSTSPAVTTLTSSVNGLHSNTHLVHAPDGIIVLDPPMLLSDARAVRDHMRDLDAPLAAVIYTHPHPDHVNGGTEIRGDRGVPVYATPETDQVSREIDGPKREFWTPMFPDDYPPVTTFATVLVKGGETVTIAGLDFAVLDIGAGECATGALWITGDEAFVGDLAYSHVHPWLYEARTHAWLRQLDSAEPVLAGKRLHVGHGPAGGVELLEKQARYIRVYQDTVRRLSGGRPSLDDAAKAELLRTMDQFWPGAPLSNLVTMSADPVAAELGQSAELPS
ncbi:MBL fold metallo-hydrolase [Streptomyces sp. NPDC048639]|uniref:MBL fold metallo-hydrolase n=1 Tax=Streptomyces sp. NPDC048639 TaxID=3365581 RepID=UPI0037131ACA